MAQRITLLVALCLDTVLGDPANRYHPVAWMGTLIASVQRYAPASHAGKQLAFGGLLTALSAGLMAGIGWIITRITDHLPGPLKWLATGVVLKLMFTLTGLVRAARSIQTALVQGDLIEARRLVGWHLVSRDTSALTAPQVAAATIESVAENISDGVIAPLFYYGVAGLPGALMYRFANTADAMLGYRDEKREWLGKIPARFDDLLNLIPARLTALFLFGAGKIAGQDTAHARAIWQRDHAQTDSPNAGHPMSMAAGLLDIELEKTGQYTLGAGGRLPEAADIDQAIHLARLATVLTAGVMFVLLAFRGQAHDR